MASTPSDGRGLTDFSEKSPGPRAVDRVCDILDAVASAPGGLGLAEIAIRCGLPKTSAFRYLAALEARRYVERVAGQPQYQIGLAVLLLRSHRGDSLVERARVHLVRLRDELGETVNLGILDGNRVTYLDIVESRKSMRLASRVGDRDYLHCTALGKAIAAELDLMTLRELTGSDPLPQRTAQTIVDFEALRLELIQVAKQGYAIDEEENEIGGRCVGVALPGLPTAAISLSAPTARLERSRVAEVAARLRQAAILITAEDDQITIRTE